MWNTWTPTLDEDQVRRESSAAMDLYSMQKGVVKVKPTCKNRSLKTTAKCRAKCCRSERPQQRRDVTASMSENTKQVNLFGNEFRATKSGRIVEIDDSPSEVAYRMGRYQALIVIIATQAGPTILDLHLRQKAEEDGNPGLMSRNTEWFSFLQGVGVIGEQYFIDYRELHAIHGPKKV